MKRRGRAVSLAMIRTVSAWAADVTLYAFKCGFIRTTTEFMLKDTRTGVPFDSPIPFFLIKHGSEWVAIDTGNNIRCARDPKQYYGEEVYKLFQPYMTESEEFALQIAKMGLKPEDLKAVILTHSHMDHAGAIEHFANTGIPIIIQKKEYEATKKWVDSGQQTRTPLDDPAMWKLLNWMQIEGVYDVFGDGTVVLIPTPGHTLGSQSIWVKVRKDHKEINSVILLGDAMYTMENLEAWIQGGVPADANAYWLSAEHMKLWRMMGFYLVPGHDDLFFSRVPLAPWPMFE